MPTSCPTKINDLIKGFIPQKRKIRKINMKEHSFLTEKEHSGSQAGESESKNK